MNKIIFSALLAILTLGSCTSKDDVGIIEGMKPLYTTVDAFSSVTSEPGKSFTSVGKIFKIGDKIYISDKGTGVHVIDNSDPFTPVKEAFLNIYGNNDMAVKQNIMYADNGSNLIAIDISDINNVAVTSVIEDVYGFNDSSFPNNYFGYFECVDPEKGYVFDWVTEQLENPKCRR